MGVAMFYHLTRRPLNDTAAMLLSRALGAGWRVVVRGQDPARLASLDAALWLGDAEGFVPHGLAGGAHDADQPILLTTGRAAPNGASCVMSIDGAAFDASDVAAMERVWVLFDGNDEAALQVARDQWRAMKDAGVSAQYWSEESGSWEKKAET